MNPDAAETPLLADGPPADHWPRNKFLLLVLAAFLIHFAGVWLFGAKKSPAPRAVRNVPVLRLADSGSELIRLTDPTLFARPHAEDFPPALLPAIPDVPEPEFRWTEAPPFLPLHPDDLGAAFTAKLQKTPVQVTTLKFKPEPAAFVPATVATPVPSQKSELRITGELAASRRLNNPPVPDIVKDDILAPSRVQVLVTPDGNVFSQTLLESSGLGTADEQALAIARSLRFAPTNRLLWGEISFTWHTTPP